MIVEAIASLYRPHFIKVIIFKIQESGLKPQVYLKWFWSNSNFNTTTVPRGAVSNLWMIVIGLGMTAQYLLTLFWAGLSLMHYQPGHFQFAMALFIATPLVWVHIIAVAVWLSKLFSTKIYKTVGKKVLCIILERQVKKLQEKHNFEEIGRAHV